MNSSSWQPVKFVRLPNISMYKETIDELLNALKIDIDLVLYRVFKLNFFMVVVSHWAGCFWFMMGSLSKRLDYSENWLDTDESNLSLSISHSDYGGFAVYLRSIYWAGERYCVIAPFLFFISLTQHLNLCNIDSIKSWA